MPPRIVFQQYFKVLASEVFVYVYRLGRVLLWKKVFELFYAHVNNGCDR